MAKKLTSHRHGPYWRNLLSAIRERHELTQAEAAAKVGVPLRTWINWENQQRVPSAMARRVLSTVFPGEIPA